MATSKRKAAAKRAKAKKPARKSAKKPAKKPAKRGTANSARRAALKGARRRTAAKKQAPRKKPAPRQRPERALVAALVGEAAEAPRQADHEVAPGELEFENDDLAEAKEIFQHYDRDGSGTIERGEFGRLLDALGAGVSEEELAAGLAEVDKNHSGRISWGEFSAWWSSR